ncbi:MAG: type III pantothenate kinase [Actinomycetota bacterium]
MLLAIDVGNTETVVGVFREEELAWRWRMATVPERTADELALLYGGFLQQQGLSFDRNVTGVVVSSVVPSATQALREMVRRYFRFPPVVVEPGVKTGVPVLTDNPKEVGADRIVNALAAFSRFGGPCVVVDFGTATTFDCVSEHGEYVGGAIAPGLQVAARSLFEHAARLPLVELVAPQSAIGKNTVESVQSGLIFGYAAMVDGMVERLAKELGQPTVVATGGLAPAVIEECRVVDHHEPWLTLEGLRLVFEKNAER